ncbi:substrate-binding domain-containing protein [Streptomyces sp. NPDC046900]|uniref:substrate-binding domain-containing protein n=1 Tax=Streptomyces sp. NPDC046900 TaxID=3155473 RepID=UPI003411570F
MSYRGPHRSPHFRKHAARVTALTACGILTMSLAACGSSSSSASNGSGSAVKIGLITKTDSNPYFVKLRESAQAEASKQGAQLIALAGKFDGDNEGQVSAIENLVSRGVKGILITPNSSSGILSAIKQARDAGVVVIALDTATDPASAVDATFATDNTAAGKQQGQWVKAKLGGQAPHLAMLDGTPGGTVDTFRHDGFLAGFGISDNDAAIVGKENTNGDQNKAQAAMENLLQRNATINALYTINEPAARGAYQAISAKGLASKVVVGSIDGSCQGVADVKAGKVGATVMQFPKKMAEGGIDAVVKYAKDGTKPSGFQDTGSQLITDQPMPGLPSKNSTWGAANCWG